MLLSQLLRDAKIEYSGADREISAIVCDSREAVENGLFVCIKGYTSDGHDYARRAYNLGCRAFIAEHLLDIPSDAVVILHENTRRALALIGAAFYGFPHRRLRVVGITGTKGKTTSALMLASVLNKNGISAGYIGSNGVEFAGNHFETQNTTPDAKDLHYYFSEMVRAGVDTAVIEVSSQALYLDRVYGIEFFMTAFTNLAPDHIGGVEHPTFEHYRDSKKKLFCEYQSSFVLYNAEDAASLYMTEGCTAELSSYGLENGDIHAAFVKPFKDDSTLGVEFVAQKADKSCRVRLRMPGEFSVENALCAMSMAEKLGVDFEKSAAALEDTYVSGRFEIVKTKIPAIFVIDYAHNGFSLTNALETLKAYSPNRLWCVIGSVGGRTVGRRAELGEAASRYADIIVLTADNPNFEDPKKICDDIRAAFVRDVDSCIIPNRESAIRHVLRNVQKDDIVLFAGKGHEQYQLFRDEKLPFSERKLIEKYSLAFFEAYV